MAAFPEWRRVTARGSARRFVGVRSASAKFFEDSGKRPPFEFDALDARVLRTALRPAMEPLELRARPLGDDLDGAVGQIARIANETQRQGAIGGSGAKENALNAANNNQTDLFGGGSGGQGASPASS